MSVEVKGVNFLTVDSMKAGVTSRRSGKKSAKMSEVLLHVVLFTSILLRPSVRRVSAGDCWSLIQHLRRGQLRFLRLLASTLADIK